MIDHGRAGAYEEPDSFVGRAQELGELREFARGMRAVTLCGAGGIGKTRLLLRLIAGLAPDFPDGTFFVGLGDLRQPDLVAARVASVIGVSEEPGVPLTDTLADALRSRTLLLALDNCEHLIDACASLCQRLLASSPGLLVVATSREALRVAAEAVWPVPPLARPAAGTADPEQAARCDAVALFTERAAAAAPGFALGPANCAAVVAICRALDGLPLAIELAAAWVRVLSAEQISARLSNRFQLLTSGDRSVPPRHRTLRATIDWSHDLLAPDEQMLLRRLSVFAGWSLEMAEQVCADDGLPAAQVLNLLAGLAEKSLVELEPDVLGQSRYRMLETIRDYAASRLAEAGETSALRRRLRDYALNLSEYFLSIGVARIPAAWQARVEVFQRYDADADNVRAVLGWALEQGDTETGLRLCTAVRPCWIVLGAFGEGAEWFDAFLAADPAGVPAAVRGQALTGRAQLALGSGDQAGAQPWALAGLELCRAAADLWFTATALNVLAETALHARRPDEARQRATEALQTAREAGDRWNQGYALGSLAAALATLGHLDEARQAAEDGLALMLEIDQQWGAARTLLGLANLSRVLGDLDAARGHYLAALGLLRQVKGDPEIARCLAGLGRIALDTGDLAAARDYLSRGLRLSLATGSRTGISRGLLAFATLAGREGRPDLAVQLAAAVTAMTETAQLPPAPAQAHHSLREGAHLPPRVAARVRRYLDEAAVLGEAQVARLWADGLQLTSSKAADLAMAPPAGAVVPAPLAGGAAQAAAAGAQPGWPRPEARAAGSPPPGPWPPGPWPPGSQPQVPEAWPAQAPAWQAQAQLQAAQRAQLPAPPAPAGRPGSAALTAREREVVALIARGASNKAIAQALFISPATAARHVANILAKLGFSSRSQVAAWAAAANSGRTGR
jgi:predicted ATPase/DNA-binding CsgD family transcriptional regulator